MEISKIKSVVGAAFLAGYQKAQTELGVRSEWLRRKDAESIVRGRGYKAVMIDRWIANGLLKEHKGMSKNSPRLYSLNELNAVLTSLEAND
jgi:hypothetical protein